MLTGHGGNIYHYARQWGCTPYDIVDMSSNINPLGTPDHLVNWLQKYMNNMISHLPEVDDFELNQKFASCYDLPNDRVLAGNGTTPFIYGLPDILAIKKAIIFGPTYADYADACYRHNVQVCYILSNIEDHFSPHLDIPDEYSDTDCVFICNPNNPTGTILKSKDLIDFCSRYPHIRFIIDESYMPFVMSEDQYSLLHSGLDNVIILYSFSKIFCIPGLRLGFFIAPPNIIEKFNNHAIPWSVNALAQQSGLSLLTHWKESKTYINESKAYIAYEKNRLLNRLNGSAFYKSFPSYTSFVLLQLQNGLSASTIFSYLAKERILIRNCENFKGLSDQYIRISLKQSDINDKLISLLMQYH